jgi:hypothetical protein
MAKRLIFEQNGCILKLSGWHQIGAVKSAVHIPYAQIRAVRVGPFEAPHWLKMLRFPGTAIPWIPIYAGSFYGMKQRFFYSIASKGPHLVIELQGHAEYDTVIVDIAEADDLVYQLSERIQPSTSINV